MAEIVQPPLRFYKLVVRAVLVLGVLGLFSLVPSNTEIKHKQIYKPSQPALERLFVRGFSAVLAKETAEPISIQSDPRAVKIDNYLARKRSPMVGLGEAYVRAGDKFGVDPFLMVAISGKESSFGKRACGYNAWGIWDCRRSVRSYEEGIEFLAWLLSRPLYGSGAWSVAQIGPTYCPSSAGCNTAKWVQDVDWFASEAKSS